MKKGNISKALEQAVDEWIKNHKSDENESKNQTENDDDHDSNKDDGDCSKVILAVVD